jgi:hypothetical protein
VYKTSRLLDVALSEAHALGARQQLILAGVLLAEVGRGEKVVGVVGKDRQLVGIAGDAVLDAAQMTHLLQQIEPAVLRRIVLAELIERVDQQRHRVLDAHQRAIDGVLEQHAVHVGELVRLVHGALARRVVAAAHLARVKLAALAVAAARGARRAVAAAHAALIEARQTAGGRRRHDVDVDRRRLRPLVLADASHAQAELVGAEVVGVARVLNVAGVEDRHAEIGLDKALLLHIAGHREAAVRREARHLVLEAVGGRRHEIDGAERNVDGEVLRARLLTIQRGGAAQRPQLLQREAVMTAGVVDDRAGVVVVEAIVGGEIRLVAGQRRHARFGNRARLLRNVPEAQLVHQSLEIELVISRLTITDSNLCQTFTLMSTFLHINVFFVLINKNNLQLQWFERCEWHPMPNCR